MKTIAIISQKGGAGKTTLAINLAGAAESARLSTLIVDLDPQASSHTWSELREHIRGEKTSPIVICTISKLLPQVLAAARKDGADLAIIDTAPQPRQHGGSQSSRKQRRYRKARKDSGCDVPHQLRAPW